MDAEALSGGGMLIRSAALRAARDILPEQLSIWPLLMALSHP